MNESNIIAIRKKDVCMAHQAFVELMTTTENIMNDDAKRNPGLYQKFSATDLEVCSVDIIKIACQNSPFDASEVKLVSGQRFPDIIADKYYGIEVKSTKADHWTSTGSSIVESTRDINVEDIYMLFGKMGGTYPKFKCRPYEDVLYDIAVTHSPRYLIDMELKKNETIFAKMGTDYNTFRKSQDNIDQVRSYYRKKALKANKLEMPWWITSENAETGKSFNVQLWNTLELEEKKRLQAMCMILFPEALNPGRDYAKYNQTSLWLCSYNQVVMPNIRDLYSAGGKIKTVNGRKLATPVAQVFNQIVQYSDMIKDMLTYPTTELLKMIAEYNPVLLKSKNLYEEWLKICYAYAKVENVPLKDWINVKPVFTFSK